MDAIDSRLVAQRVYYMAPESVEEQSLRNVIWMHQNTLRAIQEGRPHNLTRLERRHLKRLRIIETIRGSKDHPTITALTDMGIQYLAEVD